MDERRRRDARLRLRENDSVPQDTFGHGTHLAGVVASVSDSARVMPLRVMNGTGLGKVSDVAEAVRWAGDRGADVILLSLGWARLSSIPSTLLDQAIANDIAGAVTWPRQGMAVAWTRRRRTRTEARA